MYTVTVGGNSLVLELKATTLLAAWVSAKAVAACARTGFRVEGVFGVAGCSLLGGVYELGQARNQLIAGDNGEAVQATFVHFFEQTPSSCR